jgi:signal transduction histidine kinase/ActR/RegA family two-component response regulator
MSDEQVSPDPTSQDLHGALVEIRRSIESLAHRFRRVALSPSSLGPRVAAEAPEERDAFTVGEEILAIPSSGLEPSQVFSLAMDRVARVLTADRAMLFTWDALASRLVPRAGRGFRRDDLETISIKAGEGLVGQAFQDERLTRVSGGAPRIVEDPFLALFPVSDAVAVPVRSGGSALGILYAGRRAPRPPFSEAEVLLLLVIADRVGNALGQRDAIETTRGHIGRLRELEVFLGHVLVGQDMEAVLARACEVACRLAEARVAAIGVPGGTGGLALAAGMGLSADALGTIRVDSARGLTGEMFATQRPAACRDIQGRAGSEDDFLLRVGLRACLAVPVRLRRQTVGALYVGDAEARDFSADQIEAVQVLASMLALGMENNRLYGEVQGALQGLERAQEQLVQTSSARAAGAMAGGIANEFNNVLAIVLGKTQLMLSRVPDGPLREDLADIEEAGWRAADIVRRLQGFAATSADDATGPVDLIAVVQDAMTLTRAVWKDEAEARGVQIDVVTDLDLHLSVDGQATALREGVMNLILNAIDAMPQGGRLGLTARRVDTGAELQVSDTGEGIREDIRRRMFDPFFTTRAPHRTGLGLSVVQGVVTRHRGSVHVRSEPGGGTTVTLWFPVASARAVEAPPSTAEQAKAAALADIASILVLEDEDRIRAMLVEALASAGHHVESATDGLTGLARFQGGAFDVVLTDLSLPECSGLDVASSVKRLRPDTPVILITGWGHLLDPEKLREAGVDLMLVKPFRLERVLAVLADALRLRPSA